MMTIRSRLAATFAVASLTLVFAGQSHATVFAAWQVANVPFGDTLNVRKYPPDASQKQAAYPNGTVLQMTGRCAGGVNLLDIANQPAWKQRQTVRYLARSGQKRRFRHRLGLWQIHRPVLIDCRRLIVMRPAGHVAWLSAKR